MDVKYRLSKNFPSTAASNFWGFPTNPREVDYSLFATYWIALRKQVGEVATILISTGEGGSTMLTVWRISPGVIPSTPVRRTCQIVLLTHTPPDAASATTSFFQGVKSICGTNIIGAIPWSIPGFIVGGTTGLVRLLNIFCSKFPLIVWVTVSFPLILWVTVSGLRVRSPCESLTVAVFDSYYLAWLIFKFFTASTIFPIYLYSHL